MLSSWLLTCAIFRASTLKPQCGTKCTSTAREPGMSQTTAEHNMSVKPKERLPYSEWSEEKKARSREIKQRSYQKHAEAYRERQRQYYAENRETERERNRRWHQENPEASREWNRRKIQGAIERHRQQRADPIERIKHQARDALNNAIRAGSVIRPSACSQCGCACSPHGHHHDYSKSLDVVWLCQPCHIEEHKHVN